MKQSGPFTMRDFRLGVMRKSVISPALVPPNSVSHSLNVNYDTIIGSGAVRPGTTLLGATVATNKTPLGLNEFVVSNGGSNVLVGVFSGASNATIYYFDTAWRTSLTTNLSNTAKNRFAQLGNRIFRVNGVDAMSQSPDASTWTGGTTNNCMATRTPSLISRTKARLITSGDPSYKSRVWFSSVINPVATPFITWNENATSGDFIDINPDDGSDVVGFSETSTLILVFKGKGIYRLDAVNKTVDPDNIFNIGAVSQESIVLCQGVTYFFSGQDIRRTQGDFPEQISRLGVQDWIDAIPQANWNNVTGGTDGVNVYFSIGNVTLNTNKNDQTTFTNVWLKFSTRDQSWSIHSYPIQYLNFAQFTTSAGRTFVGAETAGDVQTINSGVTDNGTAIFYDLQTQPLEFGERQDTKLVTDKIVVFTRNGANGRIEIQADDGDFKTIPINLVESVAVGRDLNFEFNYAILRWTGESIGTPPVLDGFHIPSVQNQGIK